MLARLPRTPTSPATARATLKTVGLAYQVPEDKLDTATLLLSELVSNAVRHGQPGGPIELRVRLDGPHVGVSVWNVGEWFDPHESGEPREVGGWGLDIVEKLSSDWGVRYADPGVEVWFEV